MKLSDYFLKYIKFNRVIKTGYRNTTKRFIKRIKTKEDAKGIVVGHTVVKDGFWGTEWISEDEGVNIFTAEKIYKVLQVKIGIMNKIVLVDERDIIGEYNKKNRKKAIPVRSFINLNYEDQLGMEG